VEFGERFFYFGHLNKVYFILKRLPKLFILQTIQKYTLLRCPK